MITCGHPGLFMEALCLVENLFMEKRLSRAFLRLILFSRIKQATQQVENIFTQILWSYKLNFLHIVTGFEFHCFFEAEIESHNDLFWREGANFSIMHVFVS